MNAKNEKHFHLLINFLIAGTKLKLYIPSHKVAIGNSNVATQLESLQTQPIRDIVNHEKGGQLQRASRKRPT